MSRLRSLIAILFLLGSIAPPWAGLSAADSGPRSGPAVDSPVTLSLAEPGCPGHAAGEATPPAAAAGNAPPCDCPGLCLCLAGCASGGTSPASLSSIPVELIGLLARGVPPGVPSQAEAAAHRGDPFRPPAVAAI